jgi:predicted DCC family thiol-disulfide oxidoreductase YuxK
MKPGEASGTHVVIYDGDCAFCSAQVRWIKKLDWFGALKFISLTDARVKEIAPTLSQEELSTAIYCVANGGKISRAARCFRFIALRIPLLVLLAVVMWIPGVIWIAEKIYVAIARNRSKLSRFFGCKAG